MMVRRRVVPARSTLLALPFWLVASMPTSGSDLEPANSRPLHAGLSPAAQTLAHDNLQFALETLPSTSEQRWQSDDGRLSGIVQPIRTFRIKTGHFCREFFESVTIDGTVQSSVDTACRTLNGQWLVVDLPG